MAQNKAYIQLSQSTGNIFPSSKPNDVLLWTCNNTQQLLIGSSNTTPWMTFSNNNVGVGTSNPAFTLDVSGTMKATSILLGASNITSNGYTYLPNGLLLQWGVFSPTDNGGGRATSSVTFSTSFSSAPFAINLTLVTSGPNLAVNAPVCIVRSLTASGFEGNLYTPGNSTAVVTQTGSLSVRYMAIGLP